MNARIENTITTSGNVELTYLDGDNIVSHEMIHNTGTYVLCNTFAKALCGLDISKELPAAIVPLTFNGVEYVRTLSYGIPLSENLTYTQVKQETNENNVVSENGTASVVCKFTIENIFLSTGKTINGLALLNSNNEIIAKVYRDISAAKNINLAITWNVNVNYK